MTRDKEFLYLTNYTKFARRFSSDKRLYEIMQELERIATIKEIRKLIKERAGKADKPIVFRVCGYDFIFSHVTPIENYYRVYLTFVFSL